MAQTSNELLGGILITLKSIDGKMNGGASKDKPESRRGGAKTSISGSIASIFSKAADTKTATGAIKDIAGIAKKTDPKKMEAFTSAIVSFSSALPALSSGLSDLSKIKQRRVNSAIRTLQNLFMFIEDMGDNRSQKKIKRSISSIWDIGKALNKVAKPLNSMAFFLLKFGLSILGFAGSLILASYMLGKTEPLAAIGVIVGVIIGMVGLMILLGKADKWVKPGRKTVAGMGIALMALAAGMVFFIGALLVIPMMLGESADYLGMLKAAGLIGLIVGGTALLFAGIGLFDKHIKKGVMVAGWLALGLVALAGSVIIIALAAQAISAIAGIGADDPTKKQSLFGIEVPPFVYGLGVMGSVILGGLALFAILGIPYVAGLVATGVAISIAAAIGMIALAWSVKELSKIASELSGEDVAGNIEMLISGTFIGFANGVMLGLMGRKPTGTLDALKLAAMVPARTAAILGGIVLLSGVAISLSLFALSLRAFQKVGSIIPIVGHDADGKPIYGPGVSVAIVAENIATSISVFFNTLGDLFGPGGEAIIDPKKLDDVVRILMGSGGFSLLGVPIVRTGPNLMDALYGFGETLQYWGQFGADGRISMGTNAEGKPIQGPKVADVAKTIAETLGSFMRGLSSELIDMDESLADKSVQVSYILLGKKNTGLLGWLGNVTGITRDRPGILEPVSKFGEIIQQFASGKYIKGYKSDGTPEYENIDYKKTADNIVKGIQDFTKSLADGLTKTEAGGYDYGKNALKAGEFLEDFENLFSGLEKLSNAQSGMDKLAISLNSVGSGIGLIAENLNMLDADKFSKVASTTAAYQEKTADLPPLDNKGGSTSSGSNRGRQGNEPNWDDISTMIGQQVGQQVSAALSSGQFKFNFQSPTGGVMTLEPD